MWGADGRIQKVGHETIYKEAIASFAPNRNLKSPCRYIVSWALKGPQLTMKLQGPMAAYYILGTWAFNRLL